MSGSHQLEVCLLADCISDWINRRMENRKENAKEEICVGSYRTSKCLIGRTCCILEWGRCAVCLMPWMLGGKPREKGMEREVGSRGWPEGEGPCVTSRGIGTFSLWVLLKLEGNTSCLDGLTKHRLLGPIPWIPRNANENCWQICISSRFPGDAGILLAHNQNLRGDHKSIQSFVHSLTQ